MLLRGTQTFGHRRLAKDGADDQALPVESNAPLGLCLDLTLEAQEFP